MYVSDVGPKGRVHSSIRLNGESAKRIIVTGGAGFLGSALCRRLVDEKNDVLCIDNLLTGSLDNIRDLLPRSNFRFVNHDVIAPLEAKGQVDQIYNLACAASPRFYQRDPIHTFKTSVLGALNLLDLAVAKGARILQASTSEVYGDPTVSPQPERYFGNVNSYGPRSCYDEGKRGAETLFHDYQERHGLVTKIARIFNTYGPNMSLDDGRVVPNFISQALNGQNLTVYGSGIQTRSFCYRDDMISGLIRLMNSPAKVSTPVNLGNPGEFTILELAELVLEKTGSSSRIVFNDLPIDDPRQRKPDISAAIRNLKWEPTVPLSEGLDVTIDSFKECPSPGGELRASGMHVDV